MTYDEMTNALNEAQRTINIVDSNIGKLADLIVGRLRTGRVSSYTLRRLKAELQNFDSRSGTWHA